MWRWLGFHDFEHFALWCPGCVGVVIGAVLGLAMSGAAIGLGLLAESLFK